MATISHRKFIRWLPGEASEPTSTLVLTSPAGRFVDLRILLPSGDGQKALSDDPSGILPLERLDWAIAGTTSSSLCDDGTGQQVRRAQFNHWVSSRAEDPTGFMDEGDMYPQGDGSTLEKGCMLNPDTGKATDYEELWLDLSPQAQSTTALLRIDSGGVRGMIVWLGTLCQALVRDGGGISLERWELVAGTGWQRTVRMGSRALPCDDLLNDRLQLSVGSVVADGWEVLELEKN